MTSPQAWVLLAYRLPREPSSPRITVWRRLRELGAFQVGRGLVVLPSAPQTREGLEWVAQQVDEAHGQSWLWEGVATSKRQERLLIEQMLAAARESYQTVIDEAKAARVEGSRMRPQVVQRLRRQLDRIGKRDYFRPDEREEAWRLVNDLAETEPLITQ